tara:strand:- start:47 stop:253 length:207 start_codon:yes stop_codon:yes gene_type:complete
MSRPRQKAKEMIKQSTKLGNSYCAKRHCIWLCDIIIDEIYHKQEFPRYDYWQEVKKEIEKYDAQKLEF